MIYILNLIIEVVITKTPSTYIKYTLYIIHGAELNLV